MNLIQNDDEGDFRYCHFKERSEARIVFVIVDDVCPAAFSKDPCTGDPQLVEAAASAAESHPNVTGVYLAHFGSYAACLGFARRHWPGALILCLLDLSFGEMDCNDDTLGKEVANKIIKGDIGIPAGQCALFTKTPDDAWMKEIGIEIVIEKIFIGRQKRLGRNAINEVFKETHSWISSFGGSPDFWPKYASSWFKRGDYSGEIPHDHDMLASLTPSVQEKVRQQLKTYLSKTLGFPPPDKWFSEANQLAILMDVLKSFLGMCSITHKGRDDRNSFKENATLEAMNLGAFILFFASGGGQACKDALEKWDWSKLMHHKRPIAPIQTRAQARGAASAIFALGRKWLQKSSKKLLAINSHDSGLALWLDIDSNFIKPNSRHSLLEIVRELDPWGDFSGFYKDVVVKLGVDASLNRDAWCVINLKAQEGNTLLEIRPCL